MKKLFIIRLDQEALSETIHFYETLGTYDEKDYIFSISGDTVYYFMDNDILQLLRSKKQLKIELNFEVI